MKENPERDLTWFSFETIQQHVAATKELESPGTHYRSLPKAGPAEAKDSAG
ncbi:hypothetical protein TIFTF001_056252 [Ficus carica]|uniref:Uncharacterized protein n=1 Tax=Ficus carica TaxID=3494 RepID=A0AA88EII0_FICCA|nr:hypothetical protein TIFTF001_056252 [Ficus carica]